MKAYNFSLVPNQFLFPSYSNSCFFWLNHLQIVRLEFSHYDVKSSMTIPVKDFALSMVASADMNHINKLLDRVDDLDDNPDLKDLRITFEVELLAIQGP